MRVRTTQEIAGGIIWKSKKKNLVFSCKKVSETFAGRDLGVDERVIAFSDIVAFLNLLKNRLTKN